MNEFKYVLIKQEFKNSNAELISPVIFGKNLNHDDLSKEVCGIHLKDNQVKKAYPVSAGFIYFGKDIKCSGESITLNLSSREEDSEIINNYYLTNGISFKD